MKTKALFILLFLGSMGLFCLGNDDVPVAISPGSGAGVGVIENRCPTFSWAGVAGAQKYRVVVFGVEGEGTLTSKPVLSEDIAGGGLSWTPGVAQGLADGSNYAWCVGAMDAGGVWVWSETRRFRVEKSAMWAVSEGDETGNDASPSNISDSSAGNDTGKKDTANDPANPMGTEGTDCTFYGKGAGTHNSSDINKNSFFGSNAGHNNTTGFGNILMGWKAGYSNSGNYNIFLGSSTGYNNSGDSNTFVGFGIGHDNTGNGNVFIGSHIGASNSGDDNAFLGINAGFANTSGNYNTFLGFHAGMQNETGDNNTYLGWNAGAQNHTGSRNVFLGNQAGEYETGSDKLCIDNSDTSSPLIYGDFSSNKVGINGWLGVGTKSPAYNMELKTIGSNASLVAGRSGGAKNLVRASASFGDFGTINNFPVRILVNNGAMMTLKTDKSLAMASGATCTAGGVWTNASSITLKQDVTPLKTETAAAALLGLNPVTYAYKADASEKYVGFIAEEVPDLVSMNDRKSLSTMDIVAVLTKVVQEQQKAISVLQTRISDLEKKSSKEMKKEK